MSSSKPSTSNERSPEPRVFLRRFRARDCDEYTALARGSIAFHKGLVRPPRTSAQFDVFLTNSRKKSNLFHAVCLRDSCAIIGAMNLSQIFYGNLCSAYLGYLIGAAHAGQGLMREAIPLVLEHAFTTLKLHRVEANIQPGNIASIKLVRRAGFSKEGFSRRYLRIDGSWCDHERWAIVIDDWRALA